MKLSLALVVTALLILGLSLSGSFITGLVINTISLCDGKDSSSQRAICNGNDILIQECNKNGWNTIISKTCINKECNEINGFNAVCGELCKPVCKDENTIDSAGYEKGVCVHTEIDCHSGYKCVNAGCIKK